MNKGKHWIALGKHSVTSSSAKFHIYEKEEKNEEQKDVP